VIITQPKYAWYKDLDRYQWFVVAVASVGWMFDTMAQQLFNLARVPALRDLMGGNASAAAVSEQAGDATMIFMIGWAIGGAIFGAGRSPGPRQDDDAHHTLLHRFHWPELAFDWRLGFQRILAGNSRWVSRWWLK